jgi:hypothetical protein
VNQWLGCKVMKTWMRAVSFAVSLAVTVTVAMQLARFLEMDTCIDAGGRYIESTGACDIEAIGYVALFSRPRLYALWALFLGACFMIGWIVFRSMSLTFIKLSAAQQRHPGDAAKPCA